MPLTSATYVVLALNEVGDTVLEIFVLASLIGNELFQLVFSLVSTIQKDLTEIIDFRAVLNLKLILAIWTYELALWQRNFGEFDALTNLREQATDVSNGRWDGAQQHIGLLVELSLDAFVFKNDVLMLNEVFLGRTQLFLSHFELFRGLNQSGLKRQKSTLDLQKTNFKLVHPILP